ncbi:MAG TPA: hypothetical protein VFF78_05015 [Anaerolineaceae bacterium]|nr:hypothetical protein [Anaerolineaceae bacterium]
MKKAISGIVLIFLLTLVAGGIAACTPKLTTPSPGACDKIVPTFRQYCEQIGADILGEPLDQSRIIEGKECQFTNNFLLCYDRNEKLPQVRLQALSPLLYFGPEVEYASKQDTPCELYPRFVPLEQKLIARHIEPGRLLTCPIYDYSGGKITQYRENVAYSVSMNNPEAQAEILPLGLMVCSQYGDCNSVPNFVGVNSSPVQIPCHEQFERLSFGELIGLLAAGPYKSDLCDNEVVFAGIAFCMSENCASFRPLPLGTAYGIYTPPVPKNDQLSHLARFIEIQDGLGYHVYTEVDYFISVHGGYEISGQPRSEPTSPDEAGVSRQCFENYCIDYNGTLPRGQNIKLVPLGDIYGSTLLPERLVRPVFSRFNVNVLVGEAQPYIAKGERQVISLLVFNSQNQGIEGLKFTLTLKSPDGRMIGEYPMPQTDAQGTSKISIDPVEGNNGDIFEYSACLDLPTAYPICASDTFLLWP